jgi:hypothetical protein
MVFFLKQPPVTGSPEFSVRRFFYALWKGLQMIVIILIAALVCIGLPAMAAGVLGKMKSPFVLAPTVIAFIGGCFTYYIVFRYTLVGPLAAGGADPVLKTSWEMTKGNWWRIFGNSLLFGIVAIVFILATSVIERTVIDALIKLAPAVFGAVSPDPLPDTSRIPAFMAYLSPMPRHVQGGIAIYVSIACSTLNLCVISGLGKAFHCAILRVLQQEQHT